MPSVRVPLSGHQRFYHAGAIQQTPNRRRYAFYAAPERIFMRAHAPRRHDREGQEAREGQEGRAPRRGALQRRRGPRDLHRSQNARWEDQLQLPRVPEPRPVLPLGGGHDHDRVCEASERPMMRLDRQRVLDDVRIFSSADKTGQGIKAVVPVRADRCPRACLYTGHRPLDGVDASRLDAR